ncbi:MAG: sirohydrochlorin cobaltochelatase, partial [Ruminococcus sp.]|nr:sirohydrochlorin cobaltochelatase [Ruminococcus sp.]
PLMVVAGDHAHNDMAGDEEDSWKSVFEAEGYEVECLLRGLGENEAIRQLYTEHAQAAIDSIK